MAMNQAARYALIVVVCLTAACSIGVGRIGGGDVFVPRMDFGIAPDAATYTQPGDCQGGSQLAAVDVQPPDYPGGAFRDGKQGWVVVRLDVEADGTTNNIKILDADPDGPFNGASRKAVRGWRFEPPEGGTLKNCVVVLDYRFGVAEIGL